MIAATTDVANRARRRVAFRLLPYLAILYIIAFLDRTNISTAALQMPWDLGFDERVLGFGSGIFFAGYFLLEIPGAVIVEKWGARRWLSRIMVTWGIVSIGMAFVHTAPQFYSLRFLLGLAEAGFFPGVLVYLTHWFIHADRSKSVAAFMGAIPLSFIIGSPISGWLLGVHWYGMSGWRWLFIIEGLPAVIFGVGTWFYLTDWPREAVWLPDDERDWLSARLGEENAARKSIRSYTVWQAFRDPRVLLLTFAYFLHAAIAYSFVFWLPTILKRLTNLPDFSVTVGRFADLCRESHCDAGERLAFRSCPRAPLAHRDSVTPLWRVLAFNPRISPQHLAHRAAAWNSKWLSTRFRHQLLGHSIRISRRISRRRQHRLD